MSESPSPAVTENEKAEHDMHMDFYLMAKYCRDPDHALELACTLPLGQRYNFFRIYSLYRQDQNFRMTVDDILKITPDS